MIINNNNSDGTLLELNEDISLFKDFSRIAVYLYTNVSEISEPCFINVFDDRVKGDDTIVRPFKSRIAFPLYECESGSSYPITYLMTLFLSGDYYDHKIVFKKATIMRIAFYDGSGDTLGSITNKNFGIRQSLMGYPGVIKIVGLK